MLDLTKNQLLSLASPSTTTDFAEPSGRALRLPPAHRAPARVAGTVHLKPITDRGPATALPIQTRNACTGLNYPRSFAHAGIA